MYARIGQRSHFTNENIARFDAYAAFEQKFLLYKTEFFTCDHNFVYFQVQITRDVRRAIGPHYRLYSKNNMLNTPLKAIVTKT